MIDLLDDLSRIILNVLAHFHNALALALLFALDLHLVEDLLELRLLHELLVSAFSDDFLARLQLDQVIDKLVLGEGILGHTFINLRATQPRNRLLLFVLIAHRR